MWEYGLLFDAVDSGEHSLLDALGAVDHVGRMRYRTKTTKAGPRLEADIYPVWGKEQTGRARAAKKNATRESVKKYNAEKSRRYLIQLADANFTAADVAVTLTYRTAPDIAKARKDIRNFLLKVKRRREKMGLPDLKYIYVIEDGLDGKKKRLHCHMILSGGIAREDIERLWAEGYANVDRLQPTEDGLEALVRYMTKQQVNRRKWCASRNLTKPTVTRSNSRVSTGRVRRIAADYLAVAPGEMEKVYPGYKFVRAVVSYSDIVDGVYIRCVMRRVTG